jgi:DUF4097 and DUF4098 domain-containing protein YvlB
MITTSKSAKKTQNLRNKPVVYFSIDDENFHTRESKVKMITDHSKKGEAIVIEINPRFFSTWDYGKMQLT